MTLRNLATFMADFSDHDSPPLELPAGTFAAYLGDVIDNNAFSARRNYIPATASQELIFGGAGASVANGVLTTDGSATGIIRSGWVTGSDGSQNFDVYFVLIDGGYGSSDSSLALCSIAAEDDLNYYAKVTTSTDPVESRALILSAFDKSTPAGVTVRLENGLGLRGVHGFRLRVTPSLKRVSLTHMETGKFASANLPTFSWSGRLGLVQGAAYRGLQGVVPNRTEKGAEKFRPSQSLGFVGVAQHATEQEGKDACAIIVGDYVHPKVSLSPTSLTLKAGDAPATFTATVNHSELGVVWTLEPAELGTLTPNGLTCAYTPPATLAAAASAKITATLEDGRAFDGTTVTLQLPVVAGPAPKVSLAPTSLTVKPGDAAVTFTATVQNSTAGVSWKLEPSNLGTLTPNGLTASYKPPSAPGSATVATITATLVGDAAVYDGTRVNIQEATSVPSEPAPGGAVVYAYDKNFAVSQIPEDRRGLYVKGFESMRKLLSEGTNAGSAAPWDHNDRTGNAFARVNTTLYNPLLTAYFLRRPGEMIGYFADRAELIMNGIKSNVGNNIQIHPEGKSSARKAIEQEAYYDTDVTVTLDDGTTFKVNWKNWPKLIYNRRGTELYTRKAGTPKYKINSDGTYSPIAGTVYKLDANGNKIENGDNQASGTDLHQHDGIPRLAAIASIFLLLDQNRDYNRGAGKPTIAALCDWYYDWIYKTLAFYRYRAANSTKIKSAYRSGGEVLIDDYGKMINWKKIISHDFVQQNQLDWILWEHARLREGASSRRAKYWEECFRTRARLIMDSTNFGMAPNGYTITAFTHSFSKPATIAKIYGDTLTTAQAYSSGGWLPRYCDDMYPAAMLMTAMGAPYYGDGKFISGLANSFTQVAWISDTKIASRVCGYLNRYTDGTDMKYDDRWPRDSSGKPYRIQANDKSDGTKRIYDSVLGIEPEDGTNGAAGVIQRFEEVMGYEAIPYDPTPNYQNIKRCLERAKISSRGYPNFTIARGKTNTGNNVFAKLQILMYFAADRLGVNLEAL